MDKLSCHTVWKIATGFSIMHWNVPYCRKKRANVQHSLQVFNIVFRQGRGGFAGVGFVRVWHILVISLHLFQWECTLKTINYMNRNEKGHICNLVTGGHVLMIKSDSFRQWLVTSILTFSVLIDHVNFFSCFQVNLASELDTYARSRTLTFLVRR